MANISQINGLSINAATASYAVTAQNVLGSITSASYAATASLLLGSVVSASFATTASYATTAQTLLGSVVSASYAATASHSTTLGATILQPGGNDLRLYNSQGSAISTILNLTSSLSQKALTTAIIDTSTYRIAMVPTGAAGGKQVYESAFSATYNGTTGHITATGFTGSLQGTASYATQALSSSFAVSASWAPSAGGGGTPGGTVNEVQYNDGAGGFAGAANVEIDTGNLKLVSTSDPATPTGGIIAYSKVVGGRHLPKIIGPSGIDTIMQVGLHGNSVMMSAPANGTTAPTTWGGVLTTNGTLSHQQTIASSAPWQATRRTRFQTGTTINNTAGMRTAYTQWFRGSASGYGGFWFRAQLGMSINLTGGQKFVGLCNSTGVIAGDPSALLNMCGMGYDAADLNTGNWQFMYNDGTGTATRVDLGANAARSTTAGYDLIMYMAPGSSALFVRIVNLATNVTVLDTSYTTLLPVANTGMALKAEVRTTTAAADNLEIAKVYIETDY